MLYEVITPPIPSPYNNSPNPLVELPLPVEEIVSVDAVIVTHMHHVITSYSIHYTKLYEFPIPFDPDAVLSARAIASGRFLEFPDRNNFV